MSQRRIRNSKKSQDSNLRAGVVYVTTSFPMANPVTGEIEMGTAGYELTREEVSYMPVYSRAHQLMPESGSFYMDPNAYKELLAPSIEVLTEARCGNTIESDTVLRALGILGHTPIEQSIKALSVFAESDHSLAPVAGLALAECSSMYTQALLEIDITS